MKIVLQFLLLSIIVRNGLHQNVDQVVEEKEYVFRFRFCVKRPRLVVVNVPPLAVMLKAILILFVQK